MTALLLRDLKLSVRAGGGALIGVLFFITVVAVIPFGGVLVPGTLFSLAWVTGNGA